MKFVEDGFEFIPQEEGIEGVYKMMELAARTCYKTEDLISNNTSHKIIDDIIIPKGHTSVLEFGTVYLYAKYDKYREHEPEWIEKYKHDRFTRVVYDYPGYGIVEVYITTTFRTIMQGDYVDPVRAIKSNFDRNWKDDLKYWSEPKRHHSRRYCYKFVMDRGGSQSVVRHRGRFGISYAQESTRYINYNRDKFEHEIQVSIPSKFYSLIDKWSECEDGLTGEKYEYIKELDFNEQRNFLLTHDRGWCCYEESLKKSEQDYMYLVGEEKWKPEDARGVLNLDIKTEFMMCAYEEDWEMFLFRRTDKHAHPHIQKIANELKGDIVKRIGE